MTTNDTTPADLEKLAFRLDSIEGVEALTTREHDAINDAVELIRALAAAQPAPAARDGDEALREAATKAIAEQIVMTHDEASSDWPVYRQDAKLAVDQILPLIAAREAAVREQCAKVADAHAAEMKAKLEGRRRKLSDFDVGLFESAQSEAQSIAAAIRNLSPAPIAAEPKAEPVAWKPIATAPKMETVLVAGGDAHYPVSASCAGGYDEPWWVDGQSDAHAEIGWPTHWMPLPPAPDASPIAAETPAVASDVRERVRSEVFAELEAGERERTPAQLAPAIADRILAAIPSPAPSPAQADVDAAVGAERKACIAVVTEHYEGCSQFEESVCLSIRSALRARGTGEAS